MTLTTDKVQSLAHQANAYACQALLSNDRWQEVRDQKFAELVEAETLRRVAEPDLAKLTERGAVVWAGVDAQALREGHNTTPKEGGQHGPA
ncbi:MAG: hypothetical protein IV104_13355 [Acidovorax sp.]|nr:hypothetical protein [Acidovorax sp.]